MATASSISTHQASELAIEADSLKQQKTATGSRQAI